MNGSILALLQMKAEMYGKEIALAIRHQDGWSEVSYEDLAHRSKRLSNYLMAGGLSAGERIAILSNASPEWAIAFFAIVRAGGVVVPIDPKLTPAEQTWLIHDAKPTIIFAAEHFNTLESPGIEVISLERIDSYNANEREGRERTIDETALIVYTSGTTGPPKGVMLSFRNLIFEIQTLVDLMQIQRGDRFLSMLPLNHLLELTGGLLCVLYTGGSVYYPETLLPHEVLEIAAEKRITHIVTVPLFLRLLKSVVEKMDSALLPSPIQFISGGASLDTETAKYFESLGWPIYQGYGLTETSPVIAVNHPGCTRIASVGCPVPGIAVKIAEDGEILTAGPHVMQGYWNQPQATEETIDADGWLHTGDLGRLDEAGFLYITGRKKNLIVLPEGKKVQAEEVESALARSPAVKEVCVVPVRQDGYEQIGAVVVSVWQDAEAVRAEIRAAAQALAAHKRPALIYIRKTELPRTASKKIRRDAVKKWVEEQ